MKIRLSEKIDSSFKTEAILGLLIGLPLVIGPLILLMTLGDLSSRIVLIGFIIFASYIVYKKQKVNWRMVEASIDDNFLYIKRDNTEDKIDLKKIASAKHEHVNADFRENHIKIVFDEKTIFGNTVFIRPIDLNKGTMVVNKTILEIINVKLGLSKSKLH